MSSDHPIYEHYYTGNPLVVESQLRRSFGRVGREWPHRKVGITNDPFRRWREAYRDFGWKEMRLVYRSAIYDDVRVLERMMVKWLDETGSFSSGYFYNATGGGGGRNPTTPPPYYLYFVLGPPYARIRYR